MQKNIMSVNNINGRHITNYVTCVCKWLFCVTKPQVHQHIRLLGRKRKILKDEKKHHGIVDECFINWTRLPLLCEKSGAILPVLVGLTAGRLAVRQNTEILYKSHR